MEKSDINIISDSIVILGYSIEHYLILENNYIEVLWKISDSDRKLIKDGFHTLAHAKFFLETQIIKK